MTTPTVRLATVRTTGARYIVQRLTIPTTGPTLVHCWGEVTAYRGLAVKHEASVTFRADDVAVTDVPKTVELLRALFDQGTQAAVSRGARIIKRRVKQLRGKRTRTMIILDR